MNNKMHYYPEGTVIRRQPKIYFTCLSADFASCLEAVKQDLFRPGIREKSNFVLCYHRPEDLPAADEQYWADLRNMKLLVVAVTGGLLDGGDHRALAVLNFGRDHGIPVLPLLMEQGLEHRFDALCGSLHCLNRTLRQDSGVSYEEKVEKFLASVLISKELAERIRKEFDARIFLSYRKKDRDDALELMKLIHRRPACRDVAIWYDDFLTPGEDFDDGILAILRASDLFVLTVTPSILESRLDSEGRPVKNYVEETEYPEAKKTLPVLPAMMRSTDPALLKAQFPGTEDTWVDAHDEEAMTVALHRDLPQAVEKLAKRENDNDPHHNYLIGLAYLAGIDVEVDGPRAAELLTAASRDGCIDATEQLAQMYRIGNGVKQDQEQALTWAERRITQLKQQYRTRRDEDSLNLLVLAIVECGDMYRSWGNYARAKIKYSQALDCLERSGLCKSNHRARHNLALCYERMGYLCSLNGQQAEAEAYNNKALELSLQAAMVKPGVNGTYDLATTLMNAGDSAVAGGRYEEALVNYQRSLELYECLAEEIGMEEAALAASSCLGRMGNVHKERGDLNEARRYYGMYMEKAEQLNAKTGSHQSRHNLAVSYFRMASVADTGADRRRYYERSLSVARKLAEETGAVEHLESWGVGCMMLGQFDTRRRKELLTQAKKIFVDLMQRQPANPRWRQNLQLAEQLLHQKV